MTAEFTKHNMATQIEIHPIQAEILRVLLFRPEARFAELNPTKLPSDHFNFHVKKLLELNLIEKTASGSYSLTIIGKEFANRFDADSQKIAIERQAKLGILVIPLQEENGAKLYLVQQRLKQPYYGFYGFITGKIKWGETLEQTAQRELLEETGLLGKFRYLGLRHKMDYAADGRLLEDKFFFAHLATGLQGQLIQEFEGGRNLWLPVNEINRLPNLFPDIKESLALAEGAKLAVSEKKYTVTQY